ncbi:MAG: hypothetical protein LUB59_01495, partial [Candidatus Gastranaerophilales bacterium]|nr:hypothetical protein [Candidatus Gastranaerophilales bacterium]
MAVSAGMAVSADTEDSLAEVNQDTSTAERVYNFLVSDVYSAADTTGVTAPDTMSVIGEKDDETSEISIIDYGSTYSGFTVESGVTLTLQNLKIQNALSNTGGSVVNNSGYFCVYDVIFYSNQVISSEIIQTEIITNAMVAGTIPDLLTYEYVTGGGAIYNGSSNTEANPYISTIEGSFISNSVTTKSTEETGMSAIIAGGGAVLNTGTIGTLTADFTSNSVISASVGVGGAILNTGTIEAISGTFSQNTVSAEIYAYGGAIMNTGVINTITGEFSSNTAAGSVSGANAYGGAIYNSGTISTIAASFDGNYASGTSAYAGAIYNRGTIATISGSFTNNTVTGSTGAIAGAVWTNSSITFLADGEDYQISGNTVNSGGTTTNQAIFVASASATITFSAVNGGSWIIDDYISGNSGYGIYLTGDTNSYIDLNSTIQNAAVTVGNINLYISSSTFLDSNTTVNVTGSAFISMADESVSTYTFNKLTTNEASSVLFEFDIDGNSGECDILSLGINSLGAITVSNINFLNGSPVAGSYQLLSAQNTNTYLVLTADSYSYTNITPVLDWNADVKAYSYAISLTSSSGTTNDTVVITNVSSGEAQDNLSALNQYKTTIKRYFNFDSADNQFVVSANTGSSANLSSFTINGIASERDYSKINYGNTYSGFELSTGSELIINNVEFLNAVTDLDGAVLNISCSNVSVDFSSGRIINGTASGNGGAIFLTGSSFLNLTNIEFDKNSAGSGGAIYIYSDGIYSAYVTNIQGLFTNNTASNLGGAIANNTDYTNGINYSVITNISADFDNNSVITDTTDACGGAVYNTGSILSLSGDFNQNSVRSSSSDAFGGAIANAYISVNDDYYQGIIAGISSSFTGNYAVSESGTALGGAIYTANDLTFVNNSSTGTMVFENNYVIDANGKSQNAIFVDTTVSKSTLTFNLTNSSQTVISDTIDGGRYSAEDNTVYRGVVDFVDTSYNIIVQGDGTSKLTFNDVYAYSAADDGTYTLSSVIVSGIVNANVTISDVELVIGTKTFADENTTLTINRGSFNLQDEQYTTYYINKLVSTSIVEYKIDFNLYLDENGDLQLKNDVIYVGENSSGTITIIDIGLDDMDEFFEAVEYIAQNTEDGYLTVNILNRAQSTDSISLVLDFDIDDNPRITTISDYYIPETNTYEVTNNSFIGEKGLAINNTSDSFIIGILTREDTLNAINTFKAQTRIFTMESSEDTYTAISDVGTTAAGTLTVNGQNAVIDLDNYTGFVIETENTYLYLKDVTISNSPAALEVLYLDGNSEDYNVVISNTVFTGNTVAISNIAGRIYIKNSEISATDNNQFNKINNSTNGYIYSLDSNLYSSIVNNGTIILDGTSVLGQEGYSIAISGNGNISTTDTAEYTDLRYARITDPIDGSYNTFTLNSGTLRIGTTTFANSIFTANAGLIDLSGTDDGTLGTVDMPYTIDTFISSDNVGFIIDVDFSLNTADNIVITNSSSSGKVIISQINGIETLSSATEAGHITILTSASSNVELEINLDVTKYIFYVDSYLQEDRDEYILYDTSFVGEVHLSTDDTGISIAKNPVYNGLEELNRMSAYDSDDEHDVDKTKIRTFVLTEVSTSQNPYRPDNNLGSTCAGTLNIIGFYTINGDGEVELPVIDFYQNIDGKDVYLSGFEIEDSAVTTLNIEKVQIEHSRSSNNGSLIYVNSENTDTSVTITDAVIIDNASEGLGGAIYSNNTLTIIAEEIDTIFSNNRQNFISEYSNGTSNDIYLGSGTEQILNLIARNGNSIQILSGLEIADGTQLILTINDGSENSGTVNITLNSNLGSASTPIKSLILNGGTFDLHEDETAATPQCSTIYTSSLVVNSDTIFNFDVDLENSTSDQIYTDRVRSNSGNGLIVISKDNFNFINGTLADVDSVKLRILNVCCATTEFMILYDEDIGYSDTILLYTIDEVNYYAKLGINGSIIIGSNPDCSDDVLVKSLNSTSSKTYKLTTNTTLFNYGKVGDLSISQGYLNSKKLTIKGDSYSTISTTSELYGFTIAGTTTLAASKQQIAGSKFTI